MASDKSYTQNIDWHFFGTKYATFPQCDLTTSRLEMIKRGKVYEKIAFFKKRIKFELIRNIMQKMKSLRESLFHLNRERLRTFIIQDMSYDYKKNDKYWQKIKNVHEK